MDFFQNNESPVKITLLLQFKLFFIYSTQWANPIVWKRIKRCFGSNPVIRISLCGVVHIPAYRTYIFHNNLMSNDLADVISKNYRLSTQKRLVDGRSKDKYLMLFHQNAHSRSYGTSTPLCPIV